MNAAQEDRYQFVTLRTHANRRLLADDASKQSFLSALTESKRQFDLSVAAYAVLDDRVHLLYASPSGHSQNAVLSHLRGSFTRHWRNAHRLQGDGPIWERNIDARSVSDRKSLRAHIDFIHYAAVWTGQVANAADYAWSSLPERITQGIYSEHWAESAPPADLHRLVGMC